MSLQPVTLFARALTSDYRIANAVLNALTTLERFKKAHKPNI